MEKLLIVVRARSRWTRTVLNLGAAFGLAGALWFMTAPIVSARLMSPTEMIEAGLPPGVMVKAAGKPQFLTAVCAAVKNNRKAAPSIARAAVSAHREYSGDIIATVVVARAGKAKTIVS